MTNLNEYIHLICDVFSAEQSHIYIRHKGINHEFFDNYISRDSVDEINNKVRHSIL